MALEKDFLGIKVGHFGDNFGHAALDHPQSFGCLRSWAGMRVSQNGEDHTKSGSPNPDHPNKIHHFRRLSESAWLDIRMPKRSMASPSIFHVPFGLDLVSARTAWRTSPPAFLSRSGRHVWWMFSRQIIQNKQAVVEP